MSSLTDTAVPLAVLLPFVLLVLGITIYSRNWKLGAPENLQQKDRNSQ